MARRKKSPISASAVPSIPAYKQCTYHELVKDVYPQVKDFLIGKFDEWVGNGIYRNGNQFASDFEQYNGSLPKVADLYTPQDIYLQSNEAYTPTFQHDVWGCDLDFSAYMNGEPECFINIIPAELVKTNLTIRIHHAIHANIPAAKATELYLRIADLYTAALSKHNVRIIFEWAGKTGNGNLFKWEINVCDYNEVLSPQLLVSALSGPMYRAWLRVIAGSLDGGESYGTMFYPEHYKMWEDEFKTKAAIRKGDEILIGVMLNGWGCNIDETFAIDNLMQCINTEGVVA